MGPGPETETRIETHVRVAGKPVGPPPVRESLGSREIEGVQTEGSRITMTVPAGQMGNERPLVTVTESWYSAQLQASILSTIKDPLVGESTYRLVNVSLAEPAASLFEVPADYTLTEGPMVKKEVYLTK